jgi:hypothetical protein
MTDALTSKELDLLIAYCDLACKQGGINAAVEALPLAQKLLAMKTDTAANAAKE